MLNDLPASLDWQKMAGLLPVIVQNHEDGQVLMLGYMNKEALQITLATQQLTLYSRSKQRLWRKGETSGHTMTVMTISTDCDKDSLLVQVRPEGPACHLGLTSCFQPSKDTPLRFLATLIELIKQRADTKDSSSYTRQLLISGATRCAQKVGEEAVETVIAAVKGDGIELVNETSDLLYHLLVLLHACDVSLYDVLDCLEARHRKQHNQ
ncbi:bifunctional phosphoribosyl-AMP cyclohydrolase/phosphoribosyl-ATP diphosphatase HisIE [Legionella erythra]|uniref:Histidine biosynthesis bifunctional protein HisIE n=1 Tax=Legionella erythra TaxID=448 RepID=A0A0W0TRE4_LEGER|nr:bifunctional phosphoribosyl-AMP cyclohydrolase/phosphoribosyl-ATP diphosphatase HisIE [Legionella erythra]KTC97941.1 phosphoribosyl-AMP cyclohydrolase / phosphoribosyl-ATP pyrophosphatase [Legionella erythra]